MKLRVRALALAGGIVWGGYLFFATIWLLWFRDGAALEGFVALYPGYSTSLVGALVGLAWGLFDGAFCGALIAWLYNTFQERLYSRAIVS